MFHEPRISYVIQPQPHPKVATRSPQSIPHLRKQAHCSEICDADRKTHSIPFDGHFQEVSDQINRPFLSSEKWKPEMGIFEHSKLRSGKKEFLDTLGSGCPPNFVQHSIPEGGASPTEISKFDHWSIGINVERKYRNLHLVVLNLGRIDFAMLIQGVTILTPSKICLFWQSFSL